jgi:hypothetical protein
MYKYKLVTHVKAVDEPDWSLGSIIREATAQVVRLLSQRTHLKLLTSQEWWHTPVIAAFRRRRQEDSEF